MDSALAVIDSGSERCTGLQHHHASACCWMHCTLRRCAADDCGVAHGVPQVDDDCFAPHGICDQVRCGDVHRTAVRASPCLHGAGRVPLRRQPAGRILREGEPLERGRQEVHAGSPSVHSLRWGCFGRGKLCCLSGPGVARAAMPTQQCSACSLRADSPRAAQHLSRGSHRTGDATPLRALVPMAVWHGRRGCQPAGGHVGRCDQAQPWRRHTPPSSVAAVALSPPGAAVNGVAVICRRRTSPSASLCRIACGRAVAKCTLALHKHVLHGGTVGRGPWPMRADSHSRPCPACASSMQGCSASAGAATQPHSQRAAPTGWRHQCSPSTPRPPLCLQSARAPTARAASCPPA